MNSPLLLHQMVDVLHAERTATPRHGRGIVAKVVANIEQAVWRATGVRRTARAEGVPAWVERLPQCVDEPAVAVVSGRSQRDPAEAVTQECC